MQSDQYFLDLCTELGTSAAAAGNPGAGCVIVCNDVIIASAEEASFTKNDTTCHAEIEAIRIAVQVKGKDLSDCVLFTNYEPCIMCAYPIRYHRIKKVVYQKSVPYLGGISGFPILTTLAVASHWAKPPEIRIIVL